MFTIPAGSAEEYLKPLSELTDEGEDKLLINGEILSEYLLYRGADILYTLYKLSTGQQIEGLSYESLCKLMYHSYIYKLTYN